MIDLITTVRNRYARFPGYRGLSTLMFQGKTAVPDKTESAEARKRGILGLLRPQLQGVSQRLRDEVNRLFDRRDKLMMQTIAREVPRIAAQNTAHLRFEALKAEKAQTDRVIQTQKRVELLTADTNAKLKAVHTELERLKKAEKQRVQDEIQRAYEQPIIDRRARRTATREIEGRQETLRQELALDLIRAERRISRKLRDEQEYEKRRRG